jgi:hypothetical protein
MFTSLLNATSKRERDVEEVMSTCDWTLLTCVGRAEGYGGAPVVA